jgi:hypothetical protein
MKKAMGVILLAVLVLGISTMAMAWWDGPGMGMGRGTGMGMGMGHGMMGRGPGAMMGPGAGSAHGMGPGPMGGPCGNRGATGVTATTIDEAKAKEIATDYVTKNLPGFKIEKLVKFDRPRGAMYQIEVKGAKDEIRYLHINPFGAVMPFGAGRAL